MKAIECLRFAQDEGYKTIMDAWSYVNNFLHNPYYYPENYSPIYYTKKLIDIDKITIKNEILEVNELFEEFKKYGFVSLNNKGNWEFKEMGLEEGIELVCVNT